ncbi:M28 family metallopeptidase [Angustibacter peucedani]
MNTLLRTTVAAAAATALALVPAAASAQPEAAPTLAGVDVDVAAVQADLAQLQQIAQAHDGNRATATAGHAASSDYVQGKLEAAGLTVTKQEFSTREGSTWNLLAEIPGTDPSHVVMAGAHLDSVEAGPGINDDGSGSAALLETALLMAGGAQPTSTVRFAWWSGEEQGLLGSSHYVDAASSSDLGAISAYLNLDMIGSPNPGYFVYDDDPTLQGAYDDYFAGLGIATEIETEGDGRSDHAPFKDAGVPVGGLFSGADYVKTDEQAEAWGGTAGEPFDACYHQACDTTSNVDAAVLDRMTDATATVLQQLATS